MASDVTGVSGIAGRYATALYDLADERKLLDAVKSDLDSVGQLITDSADLRLLIRSPVFTRVQQAQAIAAVLELAGISDLVRRFVAVVAENRRLFTLPAMISAYRALLAERRGEVTAEVTSAVPLTEAQLASIDDVLRRSVGGKVAMNTRVDPDIIGGLIVKVGSRMIDNSLKTKLQRLQLTMKGVS
ncbi:MAG: F0F1 ATP synthase subunit delta [Alphaproteobacteria bacterium]|nr:F0F1 ATP synthase subunit delta [Alphaproteobacteria bacterium]